MILSWWPELVLWHPAVKAPPRTSLPVNMTRESFSTTRIYCEQHWGSLRCRSIFVSGMPLRGWRDTSEIGRRPSLTTPAPTGIIWPSCISCVFLFWLHHSNGALPQSLCIPIAWSGLLDVDMAWKWRLISQLAFLTWNVVINSSLSNGASWQERPCAVAGPTFHLSSKSWVCRYPLPYLFSLVFLVLEIEPWTSHTLSKHYPSNTPWTLLTTLSPHRCQWVVARVWPTKHCPKEVISMLF